MRSLLTTLAPRPDYLLRYEFASMECNIAIINACTSRRHLTEQSHGGKRRSWKELLTYLPDRSDVANEEQLATSPGALEITFSRVFMAYDVLLDQERRVFMHDLESFSWLLVWISNPCNGTANDPGTTEFEIVVLHEHGGVGRLR
jgi:hypothetical protein